MDQEYSTQYFELEKSHWWFVARKEILRDSLQSVIHHIPKQNNERQILNIGVAGGETSLMLSEFGNVTSVEFDEKICRELHKRNIPIVQADMTKLPFENNRFDIVAAFDVVEHIEKDQLAILEAIRVTKKGGLTFMTVPALNSLWSNHDEVNHHFRRYTLGSFNQLFRTQQLIFTSYFNFLLFPVIAGIRLVQRFLKKPNELKSDFESNKTSWTNGLLKKIFESEKHVLNRNIRLPIGISIMTIYRKP